jgi:hypothetical protein
MTKFALLHIATFGSEFYPFTASRENYLSHHSMKSIYVRKAIAKFSNFHQLEYFGDP